MKVERVRIRNFKGIRELEWDLRDDRKSPRTRAVLVGDNASGKTSVLQAIALTLFGVVDGRGIKHFKWPGFQLERIGTLGTTEIELIVGLSTREIKLGAWVYEAFTGRRYEQQMAIPESITVRFERGQVSVSQDLPAARFHLNARKHLARVLENHKGPVPHRLRELGGVYWFDQLRSAGLRGATGRTYEQGVAELRDELTRWDNFHKSILLGQRALQPGQRDLLQELEDTYARIFPGVSFVGVEPAGPNDPGAYFVLQRDGVTYDIAEASSGEQAVLPILYDFVREDIDNSVVIIDEIETHLHPPLAQALYNTLPKLGPDCQFLVTTHSEAVTSIVPAEEIKRIEGGRLCL